MSPHVISGEEGSGRTSRLAEIVRLAAVTRRPIFIVDPFSSLVGRLGGIEAVALDLKSCRGGSAALHLLMILMQSARGSFVAIDDCETLGASWRDWAAFLVAARSTSSLTALVSRPGWLGLQSPSLRMALLEVPRRQEEPCLAS